MFVTNIVMIFIGMILLISTSVMPYPYEYVTDDDQTDHMKIPVDLNRSGDFTRWSYRRSSSPLCDYRLQFRPLPLTSALCGYGHNIKEDNNHQINPFKYG